MNPAPHALPRWLRAGRALGVARLAGNAWFHRPTIVMYHGVADDVLPQRKFLSNTAFVEQMEAMSRSFRVVPLTQVFDWLEGHGELPTRPAALTFDDAYRNLLDVAIPEMARRGFPATIFATSASLSDPEGLLWIDEIECRLLAAGELPERLELVGHVFDLGARARGPAAARAVIRALKLLPHADRERVVAAVREQFPVDRRDLERCALLTPEQMRALPSGIEIGGHTERHAILAREAPEVQRREILGNFEALTRALGRRPASFAYPNGRAEDVTDHTVRIVREAGYRGAVTAETGLPRRGGDLFTVPRMSASFFGAYGTGDALDLLPLRTMVAAWRRA